MKKYISLIILIALLIPTIAALEILGSSKENFINLKTIVKSVGDFSGLSDTPSSYSGSGGDCVIVNSGETELIFGNCSNATGSGTGDITAVNTDGLYLTGGSVTGAVDLLLDEAFLNGTIDGRIFLNPQAFAEYQFTNNNFNGSGNFTTTGNVMGVNQTMFDSLKSNFNLWITSSVSDLINYFTKSKITAMIEGNISLVRLDINSNFTALNSVISSVNTTTNIEALGFIQGAHIVDTNASTICSGDEVLLGNGSCTSSSGFGGGATLNDGLFINYTLTKTTGNITNGSLVGYTAADEICNVEVESGSHMCQMFEIINSVRLKGVSNFTATFRVSEGAPGFTTNANDCVGWRDDTGTFLGSIWVGNNINGGQGALVSCDASRSIACCK